MPPERKLFEDVRDYINAALVVLRSGYDEAFEAAEMKFGADIVDAWAKDMIRQLRRVVSDNEYPHLAAVMQAEKEN